MTPNSGPDPETIDSIGEFALIRRIRAVTEDEPDRSGTPDAPTDLLLGIGDDAAILRPEPGWDLVLTCDSLVSGRHFDPRWMGTRAIGRRAMMVNLSDIAAMGAEPRYALVSLGLPGCMEVAAVLELYRGFLDALKEPKARIVGGNLTSSGPEWFVDITLVGRVEQGQALTRAGASPGDRILVTGSPGRAAAGLAILQSVGQGGSAPREAAIDDSEEIERFSRENPWARSLVRAFRQPQARIAAGRQLVNDSDRPVTALVDLSDGLVGDLARICECSGVRARIEAGRLPVDLDLEAAASHFGRTRAAWTLSPSDDYELLLTVRPSASVRVASELRTATGLAVTDIGEILSRGVYPRWSAAPPGDASPDRKVLPPGDASANEAAPGSAMRPGTREPVVGPNLVEVSGLSPGESQGGGWDHFRVKS